MVSDGDRLIQTLAESCVNEMGDIFWDHVPEREEPMELREPHGVAVRTVAATLAKFAQTFDTSDDYPAVLREEYRTLMSDVGEDAGDSQIVAALVRDAEWTERGAEEVMRLAREYGTFVLRNALALAVAMGIEDGVKGL